jgi:hypothetical protein
MIIKTEREDEVCDEVKDSVFIFLMKRGQTKSY